MKTLKFQACSLKYIHSQSVCVCVPLTVEGECGEGGLHGPLRLILTEHSAGAEECTSSLLF